MIRSKAEIKSFDVNGRVVEGYAAVFGNVDQGGDRIVRGAFAKALSQIKSLPVLWSHKLSEPAIGITTELYEDSYGLAYKARIAPTPRGDEILTLLDGKFIDDASFGYFVAPGGAKMVDGVRELSDLQPFELSICNVGMNPLATAGVAGGKTTLGGLARGLELLAEAHDAIRRAIEWQGYEWASGPVLPDGEAAALFQREMQRLEQSLAALAAPQE